MSRRTRRMLRTIDLFAGAGGLSLGFELASGESVTYKSVFAVEHDPAAAATYKANFESATVFAGDVARLELDELPPAEVVIGGPPCQGFSLLGRDLADKKRAKLNSLWQSFVDVVRHVQPMMFVMENVPRFHKSEQFAELLATLDDDKHLRRYTIEHGVLDAADYGVPQYRKRAFLVGMAGPLHWPPPPTHQPPDTLGFGPAFMTVRDAIADLDPVPTADRPTLSSNGAQDLHLRRRPSERSISRYRAIPSGGNRFNLPPELQPDCWKNKPTGTADVMGRMWWDRPAPTIRTEFFKPEKGRYLHPQEHRAITHREAARLQTFPDWYRFEGSKPQIARQIGNAVPPVLATAIATWLAGQCPPVS